MKKLHYRYGMKIESGDILVRKRTAFLVDKPPYGKYAGRLTLIPANTSIPTRATRKKLETIEFLVRKKK
jgi:hypothetical protein